MHPEFQQDPNLVYLNHAGVSPWPQRTHQAILGFCAENLRSGASNYPSWLGVEQRLREHAAWLLGAASADDIAILKSTSEGLSVVAYGIDWRPGDNVVSAAEEFPSNRIVWESLASLGVQSRQPSVRGRADPEAELLKACDARTRLVAVSSVQYADGLRMDLARLGEYCRREGILFCVDAIQSLGALPFNNEAIGADFVVADGHKWMLGPEGVALLYCREELRETLKLHQFGWHMVQDAGDFEQHDWQPATTARRFECGSPNMLGIHGLEASLSLIREIGIESISRKIINNTSYLINKLKYNRYTLATPEATNRRSGIVTFRVPGSDPRRLQQALMAQKVICAQRCGGIRFSPHFYTTESDIDTALQRLERIAKS